MAILMTQLLGRGTVSHRKNEQGDLLTAAKGVFEGIAEASSDLTPEQTAACAPGSMMYCLQEHSVYVKSGSGHWEVI